MGLNNHWCWGYFNINQMCFRSLPAKTDSLDDIMLVIPSQASGPWRKTNGFYPILNTRSKIWLLSKRDNIFHIKKVQPKKTKTFEGQQYRGKGILMIGLRFSFFHWTNMNICWYFCCHHPLFAYQAVKRTKNTTWGLIIQTRVRNKEKKPQNNYGNSI